MCEVANVELIYDRLPEAQPSMEIDGILTTHAQMQVRGCAIKRIQQNALAHNEQ